jgi:hypothetical protein
MELEKAKELLPKFFILIDKYSPSYKRKIKDVFVGFEDMNLSLHMYLFSKNIDRFLVLPSDEVMFTVCAIFEDGSIASVKMIVLKDNIAGLTQDVEPLDYMTFRLRGQNRNEYKDFDA